jgi:hypothetical protein
MTEPVCADCSHQRELHIRQRRYMGGSESQFYRGCCEKCRCNQYVPPSLWERLTNQLNRLRKGKPDGKATEQAGQRPDTERTAPLREDRPQDTGAPVTEESDKE